MNDPVNHPTHYNRQGIEVLDVIEAYDLPYHLGNVVKYVLRHQYKGRPEQDLRKAQYYLNRYLSEFFDTEAITKKDVLYQSFQDPTGLKARGYTQEDIDDIYADKNRNEVPLDSPFYAWVESDSPLNYDDWLGEQGYTIEEDIAKKDELYRTFPSTRYEVALPKERIAGSTDAAQDIKNEYYTHDPFLIAGYCTSCDKELQLHSPYFKALTVDAPATGYLFCSHSCLDASKAHGR